MAAGTKTGERRRLVDLLVSLGLLDKIDLAKAQTLAKQSNSHLLRVIVDQGWVDEDRLTRALSSSLGIESVTPATMKIHERVLSLIPSKMALKHRALPVAVKRANNVDYLYVALADPLDLDAIDEIQKASNCKLSVLIAPPTQLDAALVRHYGTGSDKPAEVPPPAATTAPASNSAPVPAATPVAPLPQLPPRRGQPVTNAPLGSNRPSASPPPAAARGPQSHVPEGMVLAPRSGGLPAPTGSLPPAGGVVAASIPPVGGGGLPGPSGAPAIVTGTPTVTRSVPPSPRANKAAVGLPPPVRATGSLPAPPAQRGAQLPSFPREDPSTRPGTLVDSGPQLAVAETTRPSPAPLPLKPQPLPDAMRGAVPVLGDQAVTQLDTSLFSEVPTDAKISEAKIPPRVVTEPSLGTPRTKSDEVLSWDVDLDELTPEQNAALANAEVEAGDDENPVMLEEIIDERPDSTLPMRAVRPSEEARRGENGAGRDAKRARAEAEAREITNVDLVADQRTSMQAGLRNTPPREVARTMELPIQVGDVPSPFDLTRNVQLKAGLERTGIIPAIDWDREVFEPPVPIKREASPLLAGFDDIPRSPAAVRARLETVDSHVAEEARRARSQPPAGPRMEPATELVTEPQPEPQPQALPQPPPPPPPSRLPMPAGWHDLETLPPPAEPPRLDVSALAELPALPPLVVDLEPTQRPTEAEKQSSALTPTSSVAVVPDARREQDEDARALVRGLISGDSLTSAERAQLVLALGRLMIAKGLITREELIAALGE